MVKNDNRPVVTINTMLSYVYMQLVKNNFVSCGVGQVGGYFIVSGGYI